MSKKKIQLSHNFNIDERLNVILEKYKNEDIDSIDGVKINFNTEWVHIRKSNTEPIIRIYSESISQKKADDLALRFIKEINLV